MSFGSRLKAAREAKHMSVDDLSVLSGVSRPTIYALEAGLRHPNLMTAIPLAVWLDVDINALCEEEYLAAQLRMHDVLEMVEKELEREIRETCRETTNGVSCETDGGCET